MKGRSSGGIDYDIVIVKSELIYSVAPINSYLASFYAYNDP